MFQVLGPKIVSVVGPKLEKEDSERTTGKCIADSLRTWDLLTDLCSQTRGVGNEDFGLHEAMREKCFGLVPHPSHLLEHLETLN